MHKMLTSFERGLIKFYKIMLMAAMFLIGLSIGHLLIKFLEN